MLRQAVAARRTTIPSLAAQRITSRLLSTTAPRSSLIPWRKKAVKVTANDLPVYFPKTRRLPTRQKVFRTGSYLAAVVVIYYMCYEIFATVVVDPLLDWLEEQEEQLSETERQELRKMSTEREADGAPLFFIPFPFTIKTVPQPPYKGSDPEWEIFVKVNKDTKRQREIKLQLAEHVRYLICKHPSLKKVVGNEAKVKRLWLDIIYPHVPPPKHYVSGLILDDEGIFWGDRPMDSLAAASVRAALFPKAIVLTAWTFCKSLASQTAQDVADALGFKPPPPPEITWQSMAMGRIKHPGGLGAPGNPGVSVPPPSGKPSSADTQAGNTTGKGEGKFTSSLELPDHLQVSPRVRAAVKAATVAFMTNWPRSGMPPHRGCVLVDGMVEVHGKHVVMTVWVEGWYDPKDKRFVDVSSQIKHLVPLKQAPAPER